MHAKSNNPSILIERNQQHGLALFDGRRKREKKE